MSEAFCAEIQCEEFFSDEFDVAIQFGVIDAPMIAMQPEIKIQTRLEVQ